MVGVGGHDELALTDAKKVILAQQSVDPFRIHCPSAPSQFRRDARPAIAGPFQCNTLDGIAQIHVRIRLGVLAEAVEAGPAHPRQLHHPLDRQSPAGDHFFADLPVDRGLPLDACSIRCSSMRCKHPFKKSISTTC